MSKFAILHEGKNDYEFLKLLISELGLDSRKVKFFNAGNKSNFFKLDNPNYKLLQIDIDREEIDKILFVVDADYAKNDEKYGGYTNTENELKRIITELKFTNYSDIYIVCDPTTKDGYLESFILSTIPEEHKNCIKDFLSCSEFESKAHHKSIFNQIYKIAYPKKPFDFSHKNFDELKLKLKNLFKNEKITRKLE